MALIRTRTEAIERIRYYWSLRNTLDLENGILAVDFFALSEPA